MALRKSIPVSWKPEGLSEAPSMDLGFPGCMSSLQNLIPDPGSNGLWQCRPADVRLTNFTGFNTPGFISCLLVVGTRIYGMIASAANTGHDEPFVYDTTSSTFIAITGATAANTPTSPATSGAWTPPVMCLVGGKILVAHPGFNQAGGYFFGVLDINNPAAPTWSAGTLTGAVTLPALPISIAQFSGRAYYAVENALVFSDTNDPINCTAGTQVLTLGTNQTITALIGMPLQNQVQGGIIQSLIAFVGDIIMYQVTGDAALSTLSLNQLNVATGTYSQLSVCATPIGICFISPEGVRFINSTAAVSEPLGNYGKGLARIFYNAVTPTRIVVAYAGDEIRVSLQNALVSGNPNQEYFYHMSGKRWSGPHTFPASLIQGLGSQFIKVPIEVTASLWQAVTIPNSTSGFVENGSQLQFGFETPLLPTTDDMSMHSVVEQTINLQMSSTDNYSFFVYDELNNLLASTTINIGAVPTIWGSFTWGAAPWAGTVEAYATYALDYAIPIVFKRAYFAGKGNSSPVFRLGSFDTRIEKLGYKLNYSAVGA